MLRPLSDLPPGVIGFEAVGEVHSDDYRDVLRPAVDAAIESGGVRLVYVLGPEFTGYSAGASWQDAKLGVHHLSAWKRMAVVTDHAWVDHLVGAFSWMIPGELRHFSLAERDTAVRWAAGEEPEAPAEVPAEAPAEATEAEPVAVAAEAPSEAVAPEPAPSVEPAPPVEPAPTPQPVAVTTAETPVAAAPVAQPAQPAAAAVPAQWAPDPTGRHHHRWWDGAQWTGHVADNGVSSFDPVG